MLIKLPQLESISVLSYYKNTSKCSITQKYKKKNCIFYGIYCPKSVSHLGHIWSTFKHLSIQNGIKHGPQKHLKKKNKHIKIDLLDFGKFGLFYNAENKKQPNVI